MLTSSSSNPTQGDHIQDLHTLLQGMTLSDSLFDTVTWSCKTTEESITLSRSLLLQSRHSSTRSFPQKTMPIPPSTPPHMYAPPHPQPQALQMVTQTPCQVTAVPKPIGQEVGVFYCWADIAERTNFVSGNVQKGYLSFQQALTAYAVKYDKGRVWAVPLPGGPFWPSPPESLPNIPSPVDSSASSDSHDLWSQLEDLMETMSQL
ncbi:hypothetical protein BDR06DRAFT_1012349 [Suillus hirtellus]|nr:hypothetical protein BDR06DRAFT_1012349 [Suillus hirtellus]